MKYKNIDSAIHNFGHSFMSFMNYVDDGHVVDDIEALVRKEPGEIWINFSTGEINSGAAHSSRLQKSVAHAREWLPKHLLSHNVNPEALKDITLHHRLTPRGGQTTMLAVDDRGVEHKVIVRRSA